MHFTDETLLIKNIKPYAKNAKKHPAEQVANIAESIREFGWSQPIVVDENGVVIIGHGRLAAAKKLGLKEAPCKVAHDATDEQVRKLRLLDNKTNESEWDFDLLGEDLEGLDFDGYEIDWGVEDEEPEEQEVFQDEVPEVDFNKETRCKRGDLWRLGNSYLICGDSTQMETIEKLMGDDFGNADVCVTDPPYNVDYEGKTEEKLKIDNDAQDSEEFQAFLASAFTVMHDALKEGAAFYVWHASRTQREFENALNEAGLCVRQQIIWAKNSMVLGRQDYQWKHEPCFYGWKDGAAHNWYSDRSQTTVLEFDRPARSDLHPTMKPLDLIAYQIRNSSKKGDIVIDFFGGSGSTLIACEQLERRCFTCELDEHYCDVILERWEALTGGQAEKIAGGA